MKKLYNRKAAKRIHPSPSSTHPLSSLPTAILSLAAALSPEEQEVLAYLLSAAAAAGEARKTKKSHAKNHAPELTCRCFSCYKSFWARWDSSPNRDVIHLIIDAVEEEETALEPKGSAKGRSRRGRAGSKRLAEEEDRKEISVAEGIHVADDGDDEGDDDDDDDDEDGDEDGEEESRSSVRRLVSFIGERVWGVWN